MTIDSTASANQALLDWAAANTDKALKLNEQSNIPQWVKVRKYIDDTGLINLAKHCVLLTDVDLSWNTNITNAGVGALANANPNLKDINLNGCEGVSDEAAQALSRCRYLKKLELQNTAITDTGVRAITDYCSFLEELDIRNTRVTTSAKQDMRRELGTLTFL